MGKWKSTKLQNVVDVINGFAFLSKDYVNEGHRVIRITNVQKGLIVDNDPKYCSPCKAFDKYKLYKNDLLISLTGNVGRVGLIKENLLPAYLNQRVACLREKDRMLSKQFLFYFLNSDKFEKACIESSKGIAQKNMSTEWLKEYIIPFPPLDVQQKIVAVLDKASALINLRKAQIDKLDLLIKSQFVEMFGNIQSSDYRNLKELCSLITDGTHQPPKFVEKGIPFLFVSNITGNELTYNTEKFISEETYRKLIKRTPIEIGDILLSTVGSFGHPAVVKCRQKFCFQRHIAYLKPLHSIVNSTYLHEAILSGKAQNQINKIAKGVAQKTLNLSEIKTIRIPVPTISEQNEFATFVEQIEAQKKLLQQSLEKMELNYKSLMQKCFRGEIF